MTKTVENTSTTAPLRSGMKVLVELRSGSGLGEVRRETIHTVFKAEKVFRTHYGNEFALDAEGVQWVRGHEGEAADKLKAVVVARNEERAVKILAEAKKRAAEEHARKEKEQRERDDRAVADMRAAWQLVDKAEVPKDLRRDAFRYALRSTRGAGVMQWPLSHYVYR